LVSGALTGMKTSQRTPSARAACASAWAWLPALAATTPPAQPSPRRRILTAVPRTLNEPVRCRLSALSSIGAPSRSVSVADGSTGVGRATPGDQLARLRDVRGRDGGVDAGGSHHVP
jgi:hypothetical protein